MRKAIAGQLPTTPNSNAKYFELLEGTGAHPVSKLCFEVSLKMSVGELQKLLDDGSPVDPPIDKQITPLGEASRLGYMDAVKLFVEHHADLNAGASINPKLAQLTRMTPLWLAASEGQDEVVEYLLQHGAMPDPAAVWQAAHDSTPYPNQRSKDHFEKTAQLLINAGALKKVSPNLAGLILAAPIGTRQGPPNATVLKMLLDAGISPGSPMFRIVDNGAKPVSVVAYYRGLYQNTRTTPFTPISLKPLNRCWIYWRPQTKGQEQRSTRRPHQSAIQIQPPFCLR